MVLQALANGATIAEIRSFVGRVMMIFLLTEPDSALLRIAPTFR
jgi:hypothetical protein